MWLWALGFATGATYTRCVKTVVVTVDQRLSVRERQENLPTIERDKLLLDGEMVKRTEGRIMRGGDSGF